MPDVDLPLPFEAYTGTEPFVFVSYAHADGAAVFEDITELHNRGYRIWYDEGIDPGNEWPEEIAKALDSAAWFLVFITEAAVRSQNVRNEINFALNRRKPFLAIYLEDVALPPGLELQMGTIQAILKWRTTPDHYWRKVEKSLPPELLKTPRAGSASTAIEESLPARLRKTQKPGPASTVSDAVPLVPIPAPLVDPKDGEKHAVELVKLCSLRGHKWFVNGIAVTADGHRAVSVCSRGAITVWDLEGLTGIRTVEYGRTIKAVALTPDDRRMIIAPYEPMLQVWDLVALEEVNRLPVPGKAGASYGVVVTPGGREFVSGHLDGTIMVWDLQSGHGLLGMLGLHGNTINGMALTPDGRLVISAGSDKTLKIWDIDRRLTEILDDGTIPLWESETQLRTLAGHTKHVSSVAVTPDGKRVISGSEDRTVRAWDLASGRLLSSLTGHKGPVRAVAMVPSGQHVVSCSEDGTLQVWDWGSLQPAGKLDLGAKLWACAVTPDGRTVLVGDEKGYVHFVRLEAGRGDES